MEHLTLQTFQEKVFNFNEQKEWNYLGTKPCIIDFYADRCAPCRMLGATLEEISKEYQDLIDVYKIDTDTEFELAGMFGITSIPSILFVPMNEKPQMSIGALPKKAIIQAISDLLKVQPAIV